MIDYKDKFLDVILHVKHTLDLDDRDMREILKDYNVDLYMLYNSVGIYSIYKDKEERKQEIADRIPEKDFKHFFKTYKKSIKQLVVNRVKHVQNDIEDMKYEIKLVKDLIRNQNEH